MHLRISRKTKYIGTAKKLSELRKLIKKNNLSAYYINKAHPQQSEYIAEHYIIRSYLIGFTGSTGYTLVTQNEALFCTDALSIQFNQQIANTEFEMIKTIDYR